MFGSCGFEPIYRTFCTRLLSISVGTESEVNKFNIAAARSCPASP